MSVHTELLLCDHAVFEHLLEEIVVTILKATPAKARSQTDVAVSQRVNLGICFLDGVDQDASSASFLRGF